EGEKAGSKGCGVGFGSPSDPPSNPSSATREPAVESQSPMSKTTGAKTHKVRIIERPLPRSSPLLRGGWRTYSRHAFRPSTKTLITAGLLALSSVAVQAMGNGDAAEVSPEHQLLAATSVNGSPR